MLYDYLEKQKNWSQKTFGEGKRTLGITRHIEKELKEIQENPGDLFEWIDVIILGLDGAWRTGASFETIIRALEVKQELNFTRNFPFPDSEDTPSEHIKEEIKCNSTK